MEKYNYLKQAIKIVKQIIKSEGNVDDNIIDFLLDSNKSTKYTPEIIEKICGEQISYIDLSRFILRRF